MIEKTYLSEQFVVSEEELEFSSIQDSNILMYFDFGYFWNKELCDFHGGENFIFPFDPDFTEFKDSCIKFTEILLQKKKINICFNHSAFSFLIFNELKFDFIYPSIKLKDMILDQYLESMTKYPDLYFNDYVKAIFDENNWKTTNHLIYMTPPKYVNKIFFSSMEETPLTTYKKYFNIPTVQTKKILNYFHQNNYNPHNILQI